MSDFTKDDGHAAELHVEDAVAETSVEGHKEADRRHEELERSDEELVAEFYDADIPFFEFGVEGPVSCFVAEATGFVDK